MVASLPVLAGAGGGGGARGGGVGGGAGGPGAAPPTPTPTPAPPAPLATDPQSLPACGDVKKVVVSDIDGTQTASTLLWFLRVFNVPVTVPGREAGGEMMREYAAKGYRVVYFSGSPEMMQTIDGLPFRAMRVSWLLDHGYPVSQDRTTLWLGSSILVGLWHGPYKQAVMEALQRDGYTIEYGYGDSNDDWSAFHAVGLTADRIFNNKEPADGTTFVPGGTYAQHLADHVRPLPALCDVAASPPGPTASCPPLLVKGDLAWLMGPPYWLRETWLTMPCNPLPTRPWIQPGGGVTPGVNGVPMPVG